MQFHNPHSKEVTFLSRLLGAGLVALSAISWLSTESDLVHLVNVIMVSAMTYLGPITALQTMETKPFHLVSAVLMPALTALGYAAMF
mmetsp:Transcript_33303/g.72004  ORF Transcript_33303/g.72004 Transcript_33303/m.72004 type:complete len:87 (+) Transcript_33303:396-656(+)